ncbi:MAG: peptidyl-prolyl cis-trans isomerase [Candidatus Eisenbacteria bacterium]|nr:peptidyl-prolyl cis-trans isomerase [Candidatus Eisenbacteria bacterium]
MRKVLVLVALAAVLFSLATAVTAKDGEKEKTEDKEQAQDPSKRVLAKVGNVEITEQEFNLQFRAGMSRMPASNQAMFMTPHGRKQFLDMMVDEKIWVNGALEMDLDKDSEVLMLTRMSRDQILLRKYYEKAIVERSRPTETEARAFYDANPHRFMGPTRVKIRQIVLPDSASAAATLKELKAGANFAKLARERSIDSVSAVNGGDLGQLTEGLALPASLGGSEQYSSAVFKLKQGELTDVIHTSLGYHIATAYERIDPELRPFDAVKKRIEDSLTSERTQKLRGELFDMLKDKFAVAYMIEDSSVAPGGEAAQPPKVANSPEELFQAAMDSKDSNQRIDIYRELVRRFPDSKHAAQAQFMIGFIYSEELREYAKAEEALKQVIREYPGSELVGSARWMLDNMRDSTQTVGTVEDVKKKAGTEKTGKP